VQKERIIFNDNKVKDQAKLFLDEAQEQMQVDQNEDD
jgi:hypothetical protein